MGAVFDEFVREMAEVRHRHAGHPRRELIDLLLLALEREEIVTVAYRESIIRRRLASMPIDDRLRELIRHALIWIWKDEAMHTIYVRGTLLKLGSTWQKAKTFAAQTAGGIGGWASSALQHTSWSQAPVSRSIASLITGAGRITGKVPAEVNEHLQHGPFREFCLFNIDAEKTAALCWERLVELADDEPELPAQTVADFQRVVLDEQRHERIFAALADALDENDRLIDPSAIDPLAAEIGRVGMYFLPRSMRGVDDLDNPIGSGGRVVVAHRQASIDKTELFQELLSDADLAGVVRERAAYLKMPLHDLRVAIKPSFMLGYHHADPSPITDPVLVDQLAKALSSLGVSDIAVVEGSNIYDHFYNHRSVERVAEYLGFRSDHYRIVDASNEQIEHAYVRGMGQYSVSRTWRDADLRISFGKMRSHPIELAMLSLANVEWLGTRCDQFMFIERQAQRETAIMMLLDEFPPHFALVEGFDYAPDGLVGMMGCKRPKSPGRIYAGRDALAVDQVVARHLGIQSVNESSILEAACHWFGGQSDSVDVVGIDKPIRPWRGPYDTEVSTLLCMLALPAYQLASGRGAIFTPEMDESAFPTTQPPGQFVRIGRSAMRTLLGLRGIGRKGSRRHDR